MRKSSDCRDRSRTRSAKVCSARRNSSSVYFPTFSVRPSMRIPSGKTLYTSTKVSSLRLGDINPINFMRAPLLLWPVTRCELHLLEGSAAYETVRVAESFRQFEMVVALADDQLHRLACRFHCRGEFTGLALKLWRLESSVGQDDRRVESMK